ncbi:MAG TPA: high-potential iron-sulfur protein [Steroidobacteraceae bacterium]|nr:high-potential iron-sulfur protein [Steroidobacteraceae bacterium]
MTGNFSRRRLLQGLALGVSLVPVAAVTVRRARAAEPALPLLSVAAPEAKAVHYTENAATAKEAAGNTCASCGLYQGANGSAQGPCQIFPGKAVKAAGWCSSWAGQI